MEMMFNITKAAVTLAFVEDVSTVTRHCYEWKASEIRCSLFKFLYMRRSLLLKLKVAEEKKMTLLFNVIIFSTDVKGLLPHSLLNVII